MAVVLIIVVLIIVVHLRRPIKSAEHEAVSFESDGGTQYTTGYTLAWQHRVCPSSSLEQYNALPLS